MEKGTGKKRGKPGKDRPTEEELKEAAYYRWLEREKAGLPGDEMDDWLEAEDKWRDNIVPSRND